MYFKHDVYVDLNIARLQNIRHAIFGRRAVTKHFTYNGLTAARPPNIVNTMDCALGVHKPLQIQWSGRHALAKPYAHNGLGAAHSPDITNTIVW